MSMFKKASKARKRLRLALFGPSGTGKTYSALRIGTGLVRGTGGRIAVIDSEYESSSMYSQSFDFDNGSPEEPTVDGYIAALHAAAKERYEVVIVDSLSHAWKTLDVWVQQLAEREYKGNVWSAWSEGTPKQEEFIAAILGYPGHLIGTMRSKTAWETTKTASGRTKVERIGLAPVQGKEIEYEFDMLMSLNARHEATVLKDRTNRYQDKTIKKPDEDFGEELANWLSSGLTSTDAPEATTPARPAATSKPAPKSPDAWKKMEFRAFLSAYCKRSQKEWLTQMARHDIEIEDAGEPIGEADTIEAIYADGFAKSRLASSPNGTAEEMARSAENWWRNDPDAVKAAADAYRARQWEAFELELGIRQPATIPPESQPAATPAAKPEPAGVPEEADIAG